MDIPECVINSSVYKVLQEIVSDDPIQPGSAPAAPNINDMPYVAKFWHPTELTGTDAVKRTIRGLEYWGVYVNAFNRYGRY